MLLSYLPLLNAILNSLSAYFLLTGFVAIKQGQEKVHRNLMVSALVTSTLFLISYLTYHFFAGRTVFSEPAWFRPYYLIILLTHTVLAVVIVPMIAVAVMFAIKGKFDKHRRIAKWTWPLWMYVSVTGVLIYLLLYQIFPQAKSGL